MKHINLVIEGKVQGVFFRKKTMEVALKLGLEGFVRNEENGTVYIEAEGKQIYLDEFIKWCKVGPEDAEVSNITVTNDKIIGYEEFRIEY